MLERGSAYVFRNTSGRFVQQAHLHASNAEASDRFGFSVGVSGDVVAVAATGESGAVGAGPDDNSARGSGAVYLFRNTTGGWKEISRVKAANAGSNDNFGVSVALAGQRLVVGANGEESAPGAGPDDNSMPACGAVYVFH